MPGPSVVPESEFTLADLFDLFGPLPLRRIRFDPYPGTATEDDVRTIYQREKRLYELVRGVLVEKALGFRESILAAALIQALRKFLAVHRLGTVAAEAGMTRLASGLIRIPDVSFIPWDRLPGRRIPDEPGPALAPDLAAEVLSRGTTEQEMAEKLRDYFQAGVRLVWFVDPRKRTAEVFTAPDRSTLLSEDQVLDGGDVLPGFSLPLRQLFLELDQQPS